uniref:LRRNT domain-containing protein n=1 Tax=Branchiostoma floridae TaxID=7739 RepID=C3ZTC2_BRAFL|eukprot:XP_002588158.1 hypothetical protein BRAFLDRAFT_68796 [Branchiostoma floridae]
MGEKLLRHLLIFLLIVTNELHTPEANRCKPSSHTRCCSKLGLTSIPKNLPASTCELDLQDNQISRIQPGAFANLIQLQKLWLDKNEISEIQADAFKNLIRLSALSLNDNKIKNIQDETFANVPQLSMLKLDHNQIMMIQPGLFTSLINLWWIYLNHNKIRKIEAESVSYDCTVSSRYHWYFKRNGDSTARSAAVVVSAMASGHDQRLQDPSQINIQGRAITEPNTNTTAAVVTSGQSQTGQGQSQAITECNTNTTATVVTSSSGHEQRRQTSQSQAIIESFDAKHLCYDTRPNVSQVNSLYENVAITESKTSTTAAVVTSGQSQTGQGQSQTIISESFDSKYLSYDTRPNVSQLNPMYENVAISESKTNTTAAVVTSGQSQTGQGQPQAIAESNPNTTAAVVTSELQLSFYIIKLKIKDYNIKCHNSALHHGTST